MLKAMKKLLLIFALLGTYSTELEAQHFVTSYGVELSWRIPTRVNTVMTHQFYDYQMVHVSRTRKHGIRFFDFIFQRGDVFVEVSVRNDGFIARRYVTYNYPFVDHVCGLSCGYHANYYQTFYNTCNSFDHYGHNHIVYNNERRIHASRHNKNFKNHPRNDDWGRNRNTQTRHSREGNQRFQDPTVRRGRYHDDVSSRNSRKSRNAHFKNKSGRAR